MEAVIVGVGVDVVDVDRFSARLDRAPGLRARLFAPEERDMPVRSLAARFAAKEAVAKALGAPPGLSWQDCRIPRPPGGDARPRVELTGAVLDRARALGVTHWHLSLTHDAGVAVAYVVAEHREEHP